MGGMPFEDATFGFDKWGELKASMPYGQVPVLEESMEMQPCTDCGHTSQILCFRKHSGASRCVPATPSLNEFNLGQTVDQASMLPRRFPRLPPTSVHWV
eukprot:scaffold260136_cov17-Tisochrysis_lutea.AAC.1